MLKFPILQNRDFRFFTDDPKQEVRLTDSTLEEIEIAHATYAIEQYLVGRRIEFLRFISEISDREELKRIASLILCQKS